MAYARADIEEVLRYAEDDLGYYLKNEPRGSDARAFQIYVDAMKFQLATTKETTMDDKTEVTSRPPAEGEAGWYCVIGPNVTQNHPIKRSWKTAQEDAAKHAEKLINSSFNGRTCSTKKLLVVKVVEVIEVAGPPITRRSAITKDDVDVDTSEDE